LPAKRPNPSDIVGLAKLRRQIASAGTGPSRKPPVLVPLKVKPKIDIPFFLVFPRDVYTPGTFSANAPRTIGQYPLTPNNLMFLRGFPGRT